MRRKRSEPTSKYEDRNIYNEALNNIRIKNHLNYYETQKNKHKLKKSIRSITSKFKKIGKSFSKIRLPKFKKKSKAYTHKKSPSVNKNEFNFHKKPINNKKHKKNYSFSINNLLPKTNPIKSISKITIPKFNIIRKKRTVTHKSKPNKLFTTNSIFLSIIIIIIGFMALYYFGIFGIVKECKDLDCYYEYLETCKKSHLITETNDSVFRYEILKKNGDNYCNVEVRLIKVKSNGIDSEEIEGLNMICKVNKHDQAIPDRDMQACSGRLREVFQEIIIDRLHNQILKNLPQIIEELDT